MNNIFAERLDSLVDDKVYTDLDQQCVERTHEASACGGAVEDRVRLCIKQEVQNEEFEDGPFREGADEIAAYNGNACWGERSRRDADMMEECTKENQMSVHDAEGYIFPDVKPCLNGLGMEATTAAFCLPLLCDDQAKVDRVRAVMSATEVPLDLTSRKDIWRGSVGGQSGGNAVENSVKVKADEMINNIFVQRLGTLDEDGVYADLDRQDGERTCKKMGGDSAGKEVVEEENVTLYIKQEVCEEEFEDDPFREDEGHAAAFREGACMEMYEKDNEEEEEDIFRQVAENDVLEACIKKEGINNTNGTGCIFPDVKSSSNSSEMGKTETTLNMPLLTDGDDTKGDGGVAAFLCETMINSIPQKCTMKVAEYYAAIRAKETVEAIEALKKALHREKNFPCNMCGNLFKDKRNLNRHIKRIHCDDKKFRCEICGKGFCFVSHLMRHMESHSVEKKNVCKTCGRGFSLMSNLERHMTTHTQEKPFECCVCGVRFSQNYYLQAHAVIHTGEKRFECATCGMKFGNRSNLRRHFRSHSSEKPYSCPICNQRFRFSNNISKHKKMYHKATVTAPTTSSM